MSVEIVLNKEHGLFDVLLHSADGSAPVLLGAAPTVAIGARAGEAVALASGHLSAGWVVLTDAGGVPHTRMVTRGGDWPHAVRRHLAVRAIAAEASAVQPA